MRRGDRPWTAPELWALASSIEVAAAHGQQRKAACARAALLTRRSAVAVDHMIRRRRYWRKGRWDYRRIRCDVVAFQRAALRTQGESRDGTQGSAGA